jgi:hypothetical protein
VLEEIKVILQLVALAIISLAMLVQQAMLVAQ